MTLTDRLALLSLTDAIAVLVLLLSSAAIGWWIEHPGTRRPSVTVRMAGYRREWMRQMVTRQPRIFDAAIMDSLRQGTSFFASTCVIAIGGVLALIGNSEQLVGVAEEISPYALPPLIWEMKLALVAFLLTSAFLKFVWSNRLFGYCAVVMAAVPNDPDDPIAYDRAAQAGELNIRAAWNFNRGLRWMYFSLASLAWMLGPWPLLAATAFTLWLLWSREFLSKPHDILMRDPHPPE